MSLRKSRSKTQFRIKSVSDYYEELINHLEKLFESKIVSEDSFTEQHRNISQLQVELTPNKLTFNESLPIFSLPIGLIYNFQLNLYYNKLKSKIKDVNDKIIKNTKNNDISRDSNKLIEQKKSLVKIKTHIQEQLPNLPYSPERSANDFNTILNFLTQYSQMSSDKLKKLVFSHYLDNERNSSKIKKLLRSKENLVFSKNITYSSQEFLSFAKIILKDLDQRLKISTIAKEEINAEFENNLIPIFENFFKKFRTSDSLRFKETLLWPETLTDKNTKIYAEKKDLTLPIETPPNLEGSLSSNTIQQDDIKTNVWDMIGAIFIDHNHNGIGFAGLPIYWKGKIFLTAIIEKELASDYTDALFRESQSLRILGISDTTNTRRKLLRTEIANTLDVPLNLALYPTIVRDYLGKRNIEVDLVFKDQMLRKEYYSIEHLIWNPNNKQIILNKNAKHSTEITASKERYTIFTSPPISKAISISSKPKVNLWDSSIIGSLISEMRLPIIGYHLVVEHDFPTESFLISFLPKIRSYNTFQSNIQWQLRFQISKKIDVFEGEALLPHNLWKFINSEKIPIMPFDVRIAFIAIVLSAGIHNELYNKSATSSEVILKRGINPEPLFEYLTKIQHFNIMIENKKMGKVVGIYLNETTSIPELIYCPLNTSDILNRMKRDSSLKAQTRLKKRIINALKVKESEAFYPRNLIVYLLFYSAQFNVLIDFEDYKAVNNWLATNFNLKFSSFPLINKIDTTKQEIYLSG